MVEQLPKDTLTTLDDLKRAIAVLTDTEWAVVAGINAFYEKALADAWRTAFEWREGLLCRSSEQFFPDQHAAYVAEHAEGMALIREKLQS